MKRKLLFNAGLFFSALYCRRDEEHPCQPKMTKVIFVSGSFAPPIYSRPAVGAMLRREVKRERFAMLLVRYNIINGIERFRA